MLMIVRRPRSSMPGQHVPRAEEDGPRRLTPARGPISATSSSLVVALADDTRVVDEHVDARRTRPRPRSTMARDLRLVGDVGVDESDRRPAARDRVGAPARDLRPEHVGDRRRRRPRPRTPRRCRRRCRARRRSRPRPCRRASATSLPFQTREHLLCRRDVEPVAHQQQRRLVLAPVVAGDAVLGDHDVVVVEQRVAGGRLDAPLGRAARRRSRDWMPLLRSSRSRFVPQNALDRYFLTTRSPAARRELRHDLLARRSRRPCSRAASPPWLARCSRRLKRICAGDSLVPARQHRHLDVDDQHARRRARRRSARAMRGIIGGYIEMSTPSRSNAPPGVQKSRCMSTTRSARVRAGRRARASSVKTCLPSISIMRHPESRRGNHARAASRRYRVGGWAHGRP